LVLRIVCLSLIGLIACSTDDPNAGKQPPFTREQLLDPTNCKDCHPKHYAEWSASMHAYATKDPVFLAMNKRGQEELGDQMGPFCVNCHAPMAVRENAISDYSHPENAPEQLQGVTCYFCHNAIDSGPDHFNGKGIQLANDLTMRAAISGAQFPSVHQVKYSVNHDHAKFDSSRLCGTCHDIVNQLGYHLENTFSEYTQSVVGKPDTEAFQSCQLCHMDRSTGLAAEKSGYAGLAGITKLRDVHEHLFPGVDVALTDFPGSAAMRSAVEDCKLPSSVVYLTVDPQLPTSRFVVKFETIAGHAQPSGASQDRRMWMEAVGTDNNGKVLYMGGQIADGALEEPPGTTHPCMMRDYTLDKDGKESHMFWDAASLDKTRPAPIPLPLTAMAGTHTKSCTFSAPGVNPIPTIELKLRMRPIGMDVLQDLVNSGHLSPDIPAKMPTLTVWTRYAHYNPETNQYLVDDPTPPADCEKYKCLLDPDGCQAAAALNGGAGTAGAPTMMSTSSLSAAGVAGSAGTQDSAGTGVAGAP
jgi:Cytochrome c554 and c-prime